MTEQQQKAVSDLRSEGHAVIVWTPAELQGADPGRIEDRSVELGWDVIAQLREKPECPACGETKSPEGACENNKCQVFGGLETK